MTSVTGSTPGYVADRGRFDNAVYAANFARVGDKIFSDPEFQDSVKAMKECNSVVLLFAPHDATILPNTVREEHGSFQRNLEIAWLVYGGVRTFCGLYGIKYTELQTDNFLVRSNTASLAIDRVLAHNPPFIRVYCIGSHASGKTTMSAHLAKKYNLELVPEMATAICDEWKTTINQIRLDLDRADEFQIEVYKRQKGAEEAALARSRARLQGGG
jgi:hypothetical protein